MRRESSLSGLCKNPCPVVAARDKMHVASSKMEHKSETRPSNSPLKEVVC